MFVIMVHFVRSIHDYFLFCNNFDLNFRKTGDWDMPKLWFVSLQNSEKVFESSKLDHGGMEICQYGYFDGCQGGSDYQMATDESWLSSFNNYKKHDPPSHFLFLLVPFWLNTTQMTEAPIKTA